MKVQNTSHET